MAFFLFTVVCCDYFCGCCCCYVKVFNSPELLYVFEVYGVMAFVLFVCERVCVCDTVNALTNGGWTKTSTQSIRHFRCPLRSQHAAKSLRTIYTTSKVTNSNWNWQWTIFSFLRNAIGVFFSGFSFELDSSTNIYFLRHVSRTIAFFLRFEIIRNENILAENIQERKHQGRKFVAALRAFHFCSSRYTCGNFQNLPNYNFGRNWWQFSVKQSQRKKKITKKHRLRFKALQERFSGAVAGDKKKLFWRLKTVCVRRLTGLEWQMSKYSFDARSYHCIRWHLTFEGELISIFEISPHRWIRFRMSSNICTCHVEVEISLMNEIMQRKNRIKCNQSSIQRQITMERFVRLNAVARYPETNNFRQKQ